MTVKGLDKTADTAAVRTFLSRTMDHGSRKRGHSEPNRMSPEVPLADRTAGVESSSLDRASHPGHGNYSNAVPVKTFEPENPHVSDIKPTISVMPVESRSQPYRAWVQPPGVGNRSRETSTSSLPGQWPSPLHRQDEGKSQSHGCADIAPDCCINSFSVSAYPQEEDWARSSHHVAVIAKNNSLEHTSDTQKPTTCGSDIESPMGAGGSGMKVNSAHEPKGKRPDRFGKHRLAAKKPLVRYNPWGDCSYTDLLTMAILSSAENRLTLSEIYDWIADNIPYFSDKRDDSSFSGWKNSVRHVLSTKSRFKRMRRSVDGKTQRFRGWWYVDPNSCKVKNLQEPERLCACQSHSDDVEDGVESGQDS